MTTADVAPQSRRVMAMGVFDLFHVGHLRYLQYARAQGGHLTVAVSPDRLVLGVKGKQTVVAQEQRLEIIRGLACVDAAHLQPGSTEDSLAAAAWIRDWQIEHVVVGGDWHGSARWLRLGAALAPYGITVGFALQTGGVSTTQLLTSIRAAGHP